MKLVEPRVRLISRPRIDWEQLDYYLTAIGAGDWADRHLDDRDGKDAQDLIEAAGRICYRSWTPGLNPNVTRVREDQDAYLENILSSQHGSVLEHAQFTFVIENVSRVLTHELARHRAGTATSQESMRYVRLDEIPFWMPEWAVQDDELHERVWQLLGDMERFQDWMSEHFGLDEPGVPFHEKKEKTSFMRRLAPEGVATSLIWSANVRALRHIIETRTAPGAEEEIRIVFGMVAQLMKKEAPALFGDFLRIDGDGPDAGTWRPAWRKV